jgi:signal transduction histidine kinase
MDEIVWAVNPQHDTLDSLASYLGSFTQDFLASTGVRCRLDVPLQLPNWRLDAEVRHNLFLAVKESLSNALRHAQATEVRVSLAVGERAFVIVVEDDGRGIPVDLANGEKGRSANRDGLPNMRQRLAQIGGRCDFSSRPGGGTRVEFHVVLKPAGN